MKNNLVYKENDLTIQDKKIELVLQFPLIFTCPIVFLIVFSISNTITLFAPLFYIIIILLFLLAFFLFNKKIKKYRSKKIPKKIGVSNTNIEIYFQGNQTDKYKINSLLDIEIKNSLFSASLLIKSNRGMNKIDYLGPQIENWILLLKSSEKK